mmetsp:Transcript_11424/g.17215  ORF Transcript_11424/g.17215 Transcript_11424/m.17215 type:complete len:152 (+) Transcript_11424:1461-1916(+)
MIDKFKKLDDLENEEDEVVLMLNFGDGTPHIKFSGQTTETTCMSEWYFIHNFKLEQHLPNMYKAFKRVLSDVMDKMNPGESYANREMTEFEEFIFNEVRSEEGRHRLGHNDFTIYNITEEEYNLRFPDRTPLEKRDSADHTSGEATAAFGI